MMNLSNKKNNSFGRDSALYISNFVLFGILFVGFFTLIMALYVGFPIIELTFIGILTGGLLGWILGTLLDVRAEVRYREEIRKKANKPLQKEGQENIAILSNSKDNLNYYLPEEEDIIER